MLYGVVKITSNFLFQGEHEPFYGHVIDVQSCELHTCNLLCPVVKALILMWAQELDFSLLKEGQLLKIMASVGHFHWQTN